MGADPQVALEQLKLVVAKQAVWPSIPALTALQGAVSAPAAAAEAPTADINEVRGFA